MSREPLSSRRPGRALRLAAVLGTLCLALAALTAAPAIAMQPAAAPTAPAAPPERRSPTSAPGSSSSTPPCRSPRSGRGPTRSTPAGGRRDGHRAGWSLLFRPGTYGTDAEPLQIKVGYYTEVAGLGASPSDTVINGKVEVYNRCLTDGPTQPYCVALNNFWRSMSNLTIQVNGGGPGRLPRLRQLLGRLAGVLAAPRRHPRRQPLADGLLHRGPAVRQRRLPRQLGVPVEIINGSQQQWITRNSEVGNWSNGVWNQVFAGTIGAPSEAGFPAPPYTTLDTTPLSREKPFLYVDPAGAWKVRVPGAGPTRAAPTGPSGTGAGRSLPLSGFHVATPGRPVTRSPAQLERGKNLLLTPGVYDVDRSLVVRRDDTVVLGLGQATLTAVGGAVPLVVDGDADGVVVAGVTVDAAPSSPRR